MKTRNHILNVALTGAILLSSCVPFLPAAPTATQTSVPTATVLPSPTPRPEKNVALLKPVRVSASWVVDPPERAVNGNAGDWWGAGGPAPQWIEVDLGGIYVVSKINLVEGPTAQATYQIFGRGPNKVTPALHTFKVSGSQQQTLRFVPDEPLEGISTIRVEINDTGSGWVGIREIQVFSREDPQPLPAMAEHTPLFLAGVNADKLETITKENAIFLEPLAMYGRGPLNDVAWSKDGKTLAVASPLGIWLYDSGDLKTTPRFLEGHTRDVLAVAFNPDGKSLLSGSQDGTVKEWDAATGDLIRTLHFWDDFKHEVGSAPREPEVWSIAFSADGKTVASGSYDGTIRLWDLQSGKKQTYPQGHKRQIANLEFSPDGSWLASSAIDGSLLVWDVATGKLRQDFTGQGLVRTFAFSPDSHTLAYGGVKINVHLWDTSTGEQSDELTQHPDVISLAYVPDGSALVISSSNAPLQVWDVETRKSSVFQEKTDWASKMVVSPDGSMLATNMWGGILQLWDMANGDQLDALVLHTSSINSVAFSPDAKLVASGGDDGITWLWSTEKNAIAGALLGHRGGVTGVAFSPDGKLIATSSFDRTVGVWNARTLKPVYALSGHESYVRCVAFSPDGKTIASGSTDRTVRLWDAASGKEIATLQGHSGEIEGVVFSRDGAWLASASADKTIRIWDVAQQKEAAVLTGNLSFVNDIDFRRDGTQLVTAGADHSLRLWDWHVSGDKGTGLQRPISRGHPGWILSVDYSPDGKLIASANLSSTSYYVTPGEIHLYSSDTAYPYALLRGHTKRVTSVAFSTDGKMLASGSADGSIRIWGVELDASRPTPQPVVDTATVAPTALPTESSWRDDFNGSLASGWHWNRENYDKWNLTEKQGSLRIYASPYKVGGTNSNQLLRSVPEGDFVITTHVQFKPQANFQFAGLTIFQDDNNVLSFGRAYCDDANVCVGNGIYFDQVQGGKWIGSNFATAVNNKDDAYLRLERKGSKLTAFFSYDGNDWFEIGTHSMSPLFQIKGVGLMTGGDQNKSDPDVPADFDFFELSAAQLAVVATPTIPPNLPKSGNLALNQVVSASNSESARPAKFAVDGNTGTDWGSGDFPPQWIEIDLGAPATIKAFRLLVTQYPNGTTIHRILVRTPDGEFTEAHQFEQFTSSGQWLFFRPQQPLENIQFVRIETIKSPSWVGWVEIEVMGER